MAIPTAAKLGVIAVALAGAGFMFWKNSAATSDNDAILNTNLQYFSCAKGHEFQLNGAESRKNAMANNGIILCPECGAASTEGTPCPNCHKLMPFVGHGSIPEVCPLCKKPVVNNGKAGAGHG